MSSENDSDFDQFNATLPKVRSKGKSKEKLTTAFGLRSKKKKLNIDPFTKLSSTEKMKELLKFFVDKDIIDKSYSKFSKNNQKKNFWLVQFRLICMMQ